MRTIHDLNLYSVGEKDMKKGTETHIGKKGHRNGHKKANKKGHKNVQDRIEFATYCIYSPIHLQDTVGEAGLLSQPSEYHSRPRVCYKVYNNYMMSRISLPTQM